MSTLDLARTWLAADPDPTTRAELDALVARAAAGDAAAIADLDERFAARLAFGTAGLRGVLGAGPGRMNRKVVIETSTGLGAYLVAHVPGAAAQGVVIGYDARHNSRVFAEDTARVLGGMGIRAYLAHVPWPTPTTAWAVTSLGAAAGVMVTASHNPPEYNGYKVYWGNGAQIIPPHDDGIARAIDRAATGPLAHPPPLDELRAGGHVIELGDATMQAYLDQVAGLLVARDAPRAGLVIAYTPLHGVGADAVERALAAAGFDQVHTEPSQREPDAAFPTVAFPNPEEKGAMDRVLALATRVKADLILANDPDADRLAVAIPDGDGYRQLTGDQVGALLADYLVGHMPPGKHMVATTIVSSQLLRYLALATGCDYRETLTGFKWIGNAALAWERETGGHFVMGYEEALGYSVGPMVRDKDGVSAALLFAELAAWNRAQGRSLAAHLDDVYRRVGLFVTEQVSMTAPGQAGLATIRNLMARLRATPPTAIGGHAVTEAIDLVRGHGDLPASDVLIYRLEGGHRVIVRPSGTEPKLKSYYEVRVTVGDDAIALARTRGLAELAALRDAHQALLR
ncbi:MAG: phospho-sugar mutase [Deltaproteobacteria bacterium]|nr:phospho-sugar mutase [Deltaproteobacteria bacterium]